MKRVNLAAAHRLYMIHQSVHTVADELGDGAYGEAVRQELMRGGIRLNGRHWSDSDIEQLKAMYETQTPLPEIARALCRSYYAVAVKAGRLNLSTGRGHNVNRRRSTKQLSLAGEVTPQTKWRVYGHPRGMAGKRHTLETKLRLGQASREYWRACKHDGTGMMAPEHRMRRSIQMAKLNIVRTAAQNYSRCKGGYREDIGGIYFRSSWEANYARYLNLLKARGDIHEWQYEADAFRFDVKRGCRYYRPDFKVWDSEESTPYYVEVKGWMDRKSKTKIRRMKIYYPSIRLDIVDQRIYREIENKLGRMVPGWEWPDTTRMRKARPVTA
ncbi:MAG TPA: hypothetical protein VK504_11525 [Vicinamibacterales bacterium]|nr:hypothetical protein [Vicinamibacterales bacterium]